MVYALDIGMLIGGIIILIIGIALYIARIHIPPVAQTIAYIGGILLAIIGVILIILSVVLPLAGYP